MCLALIWSLWSWISQWGLISMDAIDWPLAKVVQKIEQQGGITIRTNLDPKTPITLYLEKATVAAALEALSQATESRWRVTYIMAPSQTQALAGRNAVQDETPPPDWLWSRSRPLPVGMLTSEPIVFDPRQERWKIPENPPQTLAEFLEKTSQNFEASFLTPVGWTLDLQLKAGTEVTPHEVAQSLVRPVHGAVIEVFALVRYPRTDTQEQANTGGRGDRRWSPPDPNTWKYRMEQRLNQLPASQRTAVREEMTAQQATMQEMQGLTPEQRRKKMEERMSDPAVLERMEERQAARDEKRTPEQRRDRYRTYQANKAAAKKA